MFYLKALIKGMFVLLWICLQAHILDAKQIKMTSGLLMNVTPQMQDVGFWIAKHPYPDKTILLPSEINIFNGKTQQQGLLFDLKNQPNVLERQQIRLELLILVQSLRHKSFYDQQGKRQGADFFVDYLFQWIKHIPKSSSLRYGFVVNETSQRLLPTDQAIYITKNSYDFDELQNSVLALAEPVVILYQTMDKEWLFVKNRIASGWVKSQDIAIATKEDFLKQLDKQSINPGVVIVPRASLYADEGMKIFLGSVRMGALFVLKGSGVKVIEVSFPRRDSLGKLRLSSAFIAREDVSIGFLPFTPRMILTQAFKMLHAPYGWGDINGAQDCSRFLQMVFATVGIELPRNSSQQAQVGLDLGTFDQTVAIEKKKELLSRHAIGGITLLWMPGHVMLYLGEDQKNPYLIHATWAYKKIQDGIEVSHIIGKVVVSDMLLSETSKKGSLLKRLSSVRLIGFPLERAILR